MHLESLGHYQIVEKLGEGGMGVVFKARDTRLARFVALKILPRETSTDPEHRLRFVNEAKAASALNHPNILTVHELARDGDVDFIVTEYVEGKTLAELIPRSGLSPREALRYAVQIADALCAAHSAGIVHRDLKPRNLMVGGSGLVKVLDFGIAKMLQPVLAVEGEETESILTREGALLGTFAYMSPEQAEGRRVDPRSDIFSFGAVLYEMVTGRKAFARDSQTATLAAVLREEPPPARQVSGDVPLELERVIHRCLRKDPAKRFQSTADLKVALEELREESVSGKGGQGAGVPQRRRAMLEVATAILVLVAGFWLFRRTASGRVEPTRPLPLTSFAGETRSPALSPDGKAVAFIWNGEEQGSFDLYIKLVGPGPPVRLTTTPGTERSPAWSPDGRHLAFTRSLAPGRAALVVIPALGGPERIVAEAPHFGAGISWSPDGRWLVVSRTDSSRIPLGLYRVSLATGESTRLTRPPPELLAGDLDPAISPDGRTLAFTRSYGWMKAEIYLLALSEELSPRGEPRQLTSEGVGAGQPCWTPDGKRIVFSIAGFGGDSNFVLAVVPAFTPGAKAERVLGGEGGLWPTTSRKASLVFNRVTSSTNIWRLPFEEGRSGRPRPLSVSTRIDLGPHFSPDGKRITFSSDRSGARQLWICDADGTGPTQLTDLPPGNTGNGRFSPDGKRILVVSNPEGHQDVYMTTPNGTKPLRLTSTRSHDTAPSFSRDGEWVYFASNREDGFQVWKMRPEPDAPAVRVTRDGGYTALESADGKMLYYSKPAPGQRWSIWKTPIGGGEEAMLIPAIGTQGDFEVTETGIYYIQPDVGGARLRLLRFADATDTVLATLEKPSSFGVAVSPTDGSVLFTRIEIFATELMLIETFR